LFQVTVESHAAANFSETSTIVGAGTLGKVFGAIAADRDGHGLCALATAKISACVEFD
jgi:hypothetical protein